VVEQAVIGSAHLVHDALFYDDESGFAAALVPFLREGLARGEAAVAAVTRSNIGVLRDGLGADADAISFIDRDEWYQRPATTIAGWKRLLADAARSGRERVRVVGEVGFGTPERHPSWSRYESALNDVFAESPTWIVCPYDTRALPPELLAEARRTHPTVADPARRDSDSYLHPDEFLRRVPEPMPAVAGQPLVDLAVRESAAPARTAVRQIVALHVDEPFDRLDELLLAASEIVGNSIRHGAGQRRMQIWVTPEAVVCEVTDEGPGNVDPLAGYRPAGEGPVNGRGLWIARQVCDAVRIDSDATGTRVRFAVGRAPARSALPEPAGR
jgi:anti-sigma regulatory factor (Ser/Thr protein kinase)